MAEDDDEVFTNFASWTANVPQLYPKLSPQENGYSTNHSMVDHAGHRALENCGRNGDEGSGVYRPGSADQIQ